MSVTLTEHPGALSLNQILALGDQTTVRNAFLNQKVWLRVRGQEYGSIPLKGTYTAGETALHVQVINADTNAVIQVPDAGGTPQNWTPIGTLAGGNWAGTLDRVPCTLHYCKLRVSSDGGATIAYTSTCKFRVGARILAAGQSNMAGNFDGAFTLGPGEVYSTPAGVAGSSYFEGGVSGGSPDSAAWNDSPAIDGAVLAAYYVQQAGIPAAVATIAISAAPLSSLRAAFVDGPGSTPSGQQVIDAYGGDVEAVVMIQGESGSGSNTITWMEMCDAYHNDIATYCGRTKAEIPFLVLTLNAYTGRSPDHLPPPIGTGPWPSGVGGDSYGPWRPSQFTSANEEMLRMNARYPNLYVVGTGMGEMLNDDGLHWTSLGGYRGCRTLAHGVTTLAGYTTGFAPKIDRAVAISATETHVVIQHGPGTGLQGKTSNTNFTGFEIWDPTTGWISPTSSSIVDADTISLIHPSISDDARRIAYAATRSGVGSNPVRDNSPIAMNLIPTPWDGIVCVRNRRVVVPRFVVFYTGAYMASDVPTPPPHRYPFEFDDRYLGPAQSSDRVLYAMALIGTASEAYSPVITVIPNVGAPVPFERIHLDARFSYYRVTLPGNVTSVAFTATRPYITPPTNENDPFQWAIWQVDADDIGDLTPLFFSAYTSSTSLMELTMTDVPAHSAIMGIAGELPHRNYDIDPWAMLGFETSDYSYDFEGSTNGSFTPIAFQRTNTQGVTPDVIRLIPYDGDGTPPSRAMIVGVMALQSSYEVIVPPPTYAPGTRLTLAGQHIRLGSQRLTV